MIIKGFSVKILKIREGTAGHHLEVRVLTGLGHTGFVMTRRIKKCLFGISKLGSTLSRERESNPEEKYLEVTSTEIIVNVLLFLLSPSRLSLQS